jgi:hypothetical protein
MREKQIHQLITRFINYVWYLLHVSALHQLSISQKVLGTPPEVGNVMLKHVGNIIHN